MNDLQSEMTPAELTPPPASVLIVEDDATAARSLKFLLEHYGYRVHLAPNVQTALKMLELKPQIILLDLMLPDGDGMMVMAAMRARKLTARIAVVTGVMDFDRLSRVRAYNPQMLLQKPLNFLNLLEELRSPAA